MFDTPGSRVAGVIVLLALLVGLSIWYGSLPPSPSAGNYAGVDELATEGEVYVDRPVLVAGRIIATEPVVIAASVGIEDRIELRIEGVTRSTKVGQHLVVYGTATAPRAIDAANVVLVPAWGVTYAHSVSFFAGLWVLARIIRGWRFDRAMVALIPRTAPDVNSPTDRRTGVDHEDTDA